jgi:hypothetical protein
VDCVPVITPEDDIYVAFHTVLIQTVTSLCIGWCSSVCDIYNLSVALSLVI